MKRVLRFGRYAVNLPSAARITASGASFGKLGISRKPIPPGMDIQALVEEQKLKLRPSLYPNAAILVSEFPNPDLWFCVFQEDTEIRLIRVVAIRVLDGSAFNLTTNETVSTVDALRKSVLELASAIVPPTIDGKRAHGLAIDHAVIALDQAENESTDVNVTLADRLYMTLETNTTGREPYPELLAQMRKDAEESPEVFRGIKMLLGRKRSLGGIDGEELVFKIKDKGTIYKWATPGDPTPPARPMVAIGMRTERPEYDPELLHLWDSIITTLRRES